MIEFLLLAAMMANESTQQAWIEELREADRLTAENRIVEAERAYYKARQQAKKLGADHLPMAITLNHMGHCYQSLGRLREAERLYEGAFGIVERTSGSTSENGVKLAIDLSTVYLELDKLSQAESLIRRILRRSDELSASNRAILLAELASALARQQKFLTVESLYLEVLPVFERDPRPEFRERTIITVSNLSTFYMQTGRFAEGRRYSDWARALLGMMSDPPVVLAFKTTANAAAVSVQTGKPEDTDFLFQSAISLCERTLGRDYYMLRDVMNNYAEFLRKVGRRKDAKTASNRAKAIQASFGRESLIGLTVDVRAFM